MIKKMEDLFQKILSCVPEEERSRLEEYDGKMLSLLGNDIEERKVQVLEKIMLAIYSGDRKRLRADLAKIKLMAMQPPQLTDEEMEKRLGILAHIVLETMPEEYDIFLY